MEAQIPRQNIRVAQIHLGLTAIPGTFLPLLPSLKIHVTDLSLASAPAAQSLAAENSGFHRTTLTLLHRSDLLIKSQRLHHPLALTFQYGCLLARHDAIEDY